MPRRRTIAALALILTIGCHENREIAGLGCGPDIRIEPRLHELMIGASVRLTARTRMLGMPCEATTVPGVAWSTPNSNIVRVTTENDSTAVVSALTAGSTTVKAGLRNSNPGFSVAHGEATILVQP